MFVLATILFTIILGSLAILPARYVDDYFMSLGPKVTVPTTLMVAALVTVALLIPLFTFASFGRSWEFGVLMGAAVLATVLGFVAFAGNEVQLAVTCHFTCCALVWVPDESD